MPAVLHGLVEGLALILADGCHALAEMSTGARVPGKVRTVSSCLESDGLRQSLGTGRSGRRVTRGKWRVGTLPRPRSTHRLPLVSFRRSGCVDNLALIRFEAQTRMTVETGPSLPRLMQETRGRRCSRDLFQFTMESEQSEMSSPEQDRSRRMSEHLSRVSELAVLRL